MQEILDLSSKLIDTAKQRDLDGIANIKRVIRERALSAITNSLDPQSEIDQAVFQTIPLRLLEREDLIGAIWYIETIGQLGNTFSLEVLEQVYDKAISEREECIKADDMSSVEVIDSSIKSLFRMIKTHLLLKDDPKISVMIGYYEEKKQKLHESLIYYEQAIKKGYTIGYLASARVYEALGQYDMSIGILQLGYDLHDDIRFLGPLICLLCRTGRLLEAWGKYGELQRRSKSGTPPFIVYKGSIENDNELQILESTIASYITEESFVPVDSLKRLAESAFYYIGEEVHKEATIMERLNKKDMTLWTHDDSSEYSQALLRRLKLMQVDVLTLCNARYVEHYLRDIEKLGIKGSSDTRAYLQEFFLENFSIEVSHQVKNRDTKKNHINSRFSIKTPDNLQEPSLYTIFENISLHVGRVGELFSQPSFQDIAEMQIAPMLRASAELEGDYDEELEDDIMNSLWALGDESHYYYSLKSSVRENYENFIEQFDKEYGVFFRRHIQNMAINPDMNPDKYPASLRKYTDIGLFFWMEKMIASQFPTDDPEEIEKIVQEYSLDRTNTANALLFGSLMFDVSLEYAIGFLADFPNMLDIPEAIYIITEGLRSMDTKRRKLAIQDLHAIAREQYGARGFFDHIKYTFDDIMRGDPSDTAKREMLLVSGNRAILQKKEKMQSILNFTVAGAEFDSLEGFIQAGGSYVNIGEYDRAMECFEQAFLQDDSLAIVMKILNCTIVSGRFEQAKEYIQYGLQKGYSIENYVLAFFLWQGNTESAFLQMISMIKQSKNINDTPEGLPKLLFDAIDDTMKLPDLQDGNTNKIKIYASFILANIQANRIPPDPRVLIAHWQYVVELTNLYEGEYLHELIKQSLSPIIGELDIADIISSKEISISDMSIFYVDAHATNIGLTLKKRLNIQGDSGEKEKILDIINELSALTILALGKFPNSEAQIAKWRMELEFTESDTYKIPKKEYRIPMQYLQ